ncbi:ShlB/FhaC/HecB family hemolysin secretion/activation protein [Calothrix sp. FACHB-1219]|uniref:ShlB/FhaC/HecB family hemolysin secretion/activation protein n=1 Tax=unclassified Calothrix TaxID=2619626 RepID=UPI001682CEDF|nr:MULTISPECIES: ShlB/FhaC/HecB family hemolysin secretion/activation protein [unclassified Calothrix]MBD2207275.1 ShlB/FhaC/HecB family hemolysin secretion/activation protein [Calothrix sp. FACHB-168]MBD2216914.1 ShlB/FhaC/HecB family hemolysin secretion/activation protein [Calothrix sp. FACHB-1219]
MNRLSDWRSRSLYSHNSRYKSSVSWRKMLMLMTAMIPSFQVERLAAQVPPVEVKPPSGQQQPKLEPLPPLPPPEQLLPSSPGTITQPEFTPEALPETLTVEKFEFVGNTVFSTEELAKVAAPYTKRSITFAQLVELRSQLTKLYVDKGYVTSGVIIPPQTIKAGVVVMQVVEGSLEKINVTGTRRLNPSYVRDRLAIAAGKPFSRDRLLEGLQLLQLDPLIQSVSADLQAGISPGTNILEVKVKEANSLSGDIVLDNGRSPSVGSFRRRVNLHEGNFWGLGDSLNIGYTNTDGSNGFDISYSLPLNPRNGKLTFSYGNTNSNVIEKPFNVLDITSKSSYYELNFRQPIVQTPSQEFALGLTASHQTSQTFLGVDGIGGFPLATGADEEGRTRVSAIRFVQEWTQRSSQQVIAARSQFSLGLGILDATINKDAPDSRFFSWRGQGQWLRLLAPDTLFLLQADMQLADRELLGLEQFGIGGQTSVRGYRQDQLLTDNGIQATAEIRLPVLRVPQLQGVLQLTPFVDVGTGWNNDGANPKSNTLVSTGIGLLWHQGNNLTARLDWGIPLTSVDSKGDTWQENGLYFSLIYKPF